MDQDGRKRIVIENLQPNVNCGEYPIKRVRDQQVTVSADIVADGHDNIAAELLFRPADEEAWHTSRLSFAGNDRWEGDFTVTKEGFFHYTVRAWVDHFATWQHDLQTRLDAGQDVSTELLIGAEMIESTAKKAATGPADTLESWARNLREPRDQAIAIDSALSEQLSRLMFEHADRSLATEFPKAYTVWVERPKALFSAWYELFPRSASPEPDTHGTFRDVENLLPEIADMGFDVLYLPPIHPIGETNRKGRNNSTTATPDDPGSPWAIGSADGGHKTVHPALGTLEDFEHLVQEAKSLGIDIALDLAFQCSPDHPYVKEHPEWFRWRPDGTVQYAENPPKKYEDILPLNFENHHWQDLWEELKSVVFFWIDKGVRVFRVDNPHTKPFRFWEWLIREVKEAYPEIIFLAEAFTRPKVMYRLAKVGFTQSYTYFTWRNTKDEFVDYLTELTRRGVREFFRPNFWTNTPDILPENLQYGGRPAFINRLILAATLSSNYGIYGPAYELCEDKALDGKEEYLHSEKFEIKNWNRDRPGHIKDVVTRVNQIRRENEALHSAWNVDFYDTDNRYLMCYGKTTPDLSNILVVVVNLDYLHKQSGTIRLPIKKLGIPDSQSYLVHELLRDVKSIWQGASNYLELDPNQSPAQIYRIHRRLRRENDFDYYL